MSYQFDGTSYQVLNGTGFYPANGCTFSIWIKLNSIGGGVNRSVLSTVKNFPITLTNPTFYPNFLILIDDSERCVFRYDDGNGKSAIADTGDDLVMDTWHNIICTCYNDSANLYLSIYHDGIYGTYPFTPPYPIAEDSLGFYVGFDSVNGIPISELPFYGEMAELAIWDTVLEANDIKQLGSTRIRELPYQIHPESLKFYYPMNNGNNGQVISTWDNRVYNGIASTSQTTTGVIYGKADIISTQ